MKNLTSFVVLFLSLYTMAHAQMPYLYTCAENGQIEAAKRQAMEVSAQNFIQLQLGSDADAAYALMAEMGKQVTSREEFANVAKTVRSFELKNLKVQHSYVISLIGEFSGVAVCGADLSKPARRVSVGVANLPEQGYVSLSADAPNYQWVFTLWLVPEKGSWKILGFWSNNATLGDKSTEQLLDLARTEKQKKHTFNSTLFYLSSMQTAYRGPNFRLGISDVLAEEASQLSLPPQLQGDPPFSWKSADTTFKIRGLGAMPNAGKLYLLIEHETSPWAKESDADALNKKLIKYFKGLFPEYSDVFARIVVRAHERGGTHEYETVDETK